MKRPGEWIRARAAAICGSAAAERLVDPIIADMQLEYDAAIRGKRRWQARRIVMSGYFGLALALLLHWSQSMRALREWTEEERRALRRMCGIAAAAAIVAVGVFILPPLEFLARNALSANARVVMLLIPQALPIAIPIGISFGVVMGLRRETDMRRLTAAIVLVSVLCSIASFVTFNEIIPASNQAFRQAVLARRPDYVVGRGLNELTLGELRRQMAGERIADLDYRFDPNVAAVTYHVRWAVSFAAIAFAVLALSLVRQRSLKRWVGAVLSVAAAAGYYAILNVGVGFGRDGTLPPFAGAWVANLVFVLIAAALVMKASGETRTNQGGGAPITS